MSSPQTTPECHLDVDELAQRCQAEMQKYLAGMSYDEEYCLILFRRALLDNDQSAWRAIYAQYHALVARWVWQHPKFHAVDEEVTFFVNVAFTRFWRGLSGSKTNSKFDSLGPLLRYLKSCVHSAIEDAHRRQQRWPYETLPWHSLSELVDHSQPLKMPGGDSFTEALEQAILNRLRNQEEEIVARLSWFYGLSPRQIQLRYPNIFLDVSRG